MKVIGKIEIRWSGIESKFCSRIGLGIPTQDGHTVEELRSAKQCFGDVLGLWWGFVDPDEDKDYRWRWLTIKGDDPESLKDQSIKILDEAFTLLRDVARENREKSLLNKAITLEVEIH